MTGPLSELRATLTAEIERLTAQLGAVDEAESALTKLQAGVRRP
jgi:uncharacterized small protein (DUF1192 family)